MRPKCPYCGKINKPKNIIDVGHLRLKNMSKKGNTRNVYLCLGCGECFDGLLKPEDLDKPVDVSLNRKDSYHKCNWRPDEKDL